MPVIVVVFLWIDIYIRRIHSSFIHCSPFAFSENKWDGICVPYLCSKWPGWIALQTDKKKAPYIRSYTILQFCMSFDIWLSFVCTSPWVYFTSSSDKQISSFNRMRLLRMLRQCAWKLQIQFYLIKFINISLDKSSLQCEEATHSLLFFWKLQRHSMRFQRIF